MLRFTSQVIATPGRFVHLCVEMGLRLDSVEYVVFDEADRLFEMGFGEQGGNTIEKKIVVWLEIPCKLIGI